MSAKAMKKKAKTTKLDFIGWNTSDVDEIKRRNIRGQTEKFNIKNIEPKYIYFSTFSVSSKQDKTYVVEIRSLNEYVNSCNCPDYQSNALGTCKHIEHVLFRLKKLGAKRFKEACYLGGTRVEIFWDPKKVPGVRVIWPKKISRKLYSILGSYFSSDGTLVGNLVSAYPMLCEVISKNQKQLKQNIRVSQHIEHVIENQRRIAQKQARKEIFLADVKTGKQSLNLVNFPLYSYQQEGMLHLVFTERALLADEMGLGKTVQAIAACEFLRRHKNIQRVLVIATASLKAEWEEQIKKFTGLSTQIIQGSRAERLRQYQCQSFFYLTNYEQVVIDKSDIQRLLSPDVIILDEAQRIKNWQTKTATAVKQLKSPYAFVLTGTPLENRIDDVYSIVQFLDPNIFGALFRFNRDFYELDEKGKPIGYKNLDALYHRLRPVMLRRLKSDVEGQLPKKTVNTYFVGMEKEQRIRYDEYKDLVARLFSQAKRRPLRKEEHEKLQKWLACMRMLCDTPYILDSNCRISPKLSELENILEELLTDKNNKIIIFSEWERMLTLVRELAKKKQLHCAWHTGSVPQQKRREEINRFKQQPSCQLFLSTDSGSVGLNLQVANIVINLDLPWNPAKLEQRIARAWRKHQTRPVQVINFVCENSIEHQILHLLDQKKTLATGVLEGKDNLKEMKLPSGRAAFMERMENLMGNFSASFQSARTTHVTTPPSPPSKAETATFDTYANLHAALLAEMPDQIDLLQTHHNKETGKHTLLMVTDGNHTQAQKILQTSVATDSELLATLETLDYKTFMQIQRLVQAGILNFNQPEQILHTSQKLSESKKDLREKQLQQARKHLEEAARKQRMAQILIEGDFHEEAVEPIQKALNATLSSFNCLLGMQNESSFTYPLIKEKFIEQHGLPHEALSMFMQLEDKVNKVSSATIKAFFLDQQTIFQHVNEKLHQAFLK